MRATASEVTLRVANTSFIYHDHDLDLDPWGSRFLPGFQLHVMLQVVRGNISRLCQYISYFFAYRVELM
jgi:hypothetical protein